MRPLIPVFISALVPSPRETRGRRSERLLASAWQVLQESTDSVSAKPRQSDSGPPLPRDAAQLVSCWDWPCVRGRVCVHLALSSTCRSSQPVPPFPVQSLVLLLPGVLSPAWRLEKFLPAGSGWLPTRPLQTMVISFLPSPEHNAFTHLSLAC